jgi:hypothetical protein
MTAQASVTAPPAAAPTVPPPTSDDSQLAQKEVEFYAATVNAWYATTLEHDKSLFILAGGGIGIMISLLTTVGFDNYWVLSLFLLAIFSFLNCLAYLLRIFEGNRTYLEAIVQGAHQGADANLQRWDKIAKNSFLVGVISSTVVGVAVAALKIPTKQMENNQVSSESRNPSERAMTLDSVQGAARLQPLGKSFQGAANMVPPSAAAATATAASAATSPAAAAQPASTPVPSPAGATTPALPGAKP